MMSLWVTDGEGHSRRLRQPVAAIMTHSAFVVICGVVGGPFGRARRVTRRFNQPLDNETSAVGNAETSIH